MFKNHRRWGKPHFIRGTPEHHPCKFDPLKTNQRLNSKVTIHGLCVCVMFPRHYGTEGRPGLCPAFHFSCTHQSTCELRGNPTVGADGLRTRLLILELVLDVRYEEPNGIKSPPEVEPEVWCQIWLPCNNIISDRLVSSLAAAGYQELLAVMRGTACSLGLSALETTSPRPAVQGRAPVLGM